MTIDPGMRWLDAVTRREVLRGALAGGVALTAGGWLGACGGGDDGGGGGGTPATSSDTGNAKLKAGGIIRAGATGGGREGLDRRPQARRRPGHHAGLEHVRVARGPHAGLRRARDAARRVDRGRQDAEDVGHPAQGGPHLPQRQAGHGRRRDLLAPADHRPEGPEGRRRVDRLHRRATGSRRWTTAPSACRCSSPTPASRTTSASTSTAIVPVDYDPANPVGTGPYKYDSFTPGEQSRFLKNPDYWEDGKPYADELIIIDFTDDTARVNALLGGQVDAITTLPAAQIANVQGNPAFKVLISETGAWQPFTMRIDAAPFDDNRVRQAFRLIVDRQQMVDQVLSGQGRIANDLYAPYDAELRLRAAAARAGPRAGQVAAQAGRPGGAHASSSSPRRVFQGIVEAAQVFAEQAKGAGVTVKLRKVDSGTFYGDNYLKWPFAQDFWATRVYLAQVAQGDLPELAVQRDPLGRRASSRT